MNPYATRQITVLQYIFFIHGAQVGIGILTIPRDVAEIAGTDGWIGIILGWLAAIMASLIIVNTMKRYPECTIIDLMPLFFGKWLGKCLIAVTVLYCAYAATTVLANTGGILKVWLLPLTPFYQIMILLLIPVLFLVGKGVKTLARYAELIFYLSLWVPIALIVSLKEPQYLYLLPVLKEGWGPVLKAVPTTILSFLGFELAFFLYPHLQKKQFAAVGIVIANTLSMLLFLFVTLIAYVIFSPDQITKFIWPVLSMWKGVEYRFLERIDILFLAFYLFIISTTWMPYMYFTVFGAGRLFKKSNEKKYLLGFMALLVAVTMFYTPSFFDIRKLGETWSKAGMIFGYAVPFFLWGYERLFHKYRQRRMP